MAKIGNVCGHFSQMENLWEVAAFSMFFVF